MEKDKIKVGDTVKVKMKNRMREGETGTVRTINRAKNGTEFYVQFDGESFLYTFYEHEIEKVKSMKIKRLTNTAQLPTRASNGAAGLDLYADVPGAIAIYPGETKKIHTGIAIELRPYQVGLVYPRSGLATKQGLRLANSVGVIDSDYRGEIIIALHNDSQMVQYIENGERIAQLVVMQYEHEDAQEVEELSGTERGSGGFGSTGVK